MYTLRREKSPSLKAGVIAAKAPRAKRYKPIMRPMGRYSFENLDRMR
jgi:hypothetical protein